MLQLTFNPGVNVNRHSNNPAQKLPIFDKNSFIKVQKSSVIFKVFGTEGICLQDLKQNSVIRVQVLVVESI